MNTSTLSLTLVETDAAPSAVSPPASADRNALTIDIPPVERPVPVSKQPVIADAYANQAAREYAQGLVDQSLWDRALLEARGEKVDAAGIYLRARGIALRVAARHTARELEAAVEPADDALNEKRRRFARRAKWISYRRPAAAAISAAAATILVVALFTVRSDPAPTTDAAVTPRPVPVAPTTVPVPKPAPVVAAPAAADDSLAALRAKIDELRLAGNWHVLALYAVEWTRREPENAAAWNQLRTAYMFLRQLDDALAAATMAARLAPGNPAMWRRLGEINVELDDAIGALAAFREAVALEPSDLISLRAIGLLETRLGRSVEAKATFARALAAHPGDSITTCLRNGAAQLPPTQDARVALRQVATLEATCHGRLDGMVAVR